MEATLRRMREDGSLAAYEIVDAADDGDAGREIRLVFDPAMPAEARQRSIESLIVEAAAGGVRVTITAVTADGPAPARGDAATGPAATLPWWRRLFRR
ncbi:MAG TPA: hypothetical protein VHD15_16960 [Hyphomicrobiales bacterium]|nr:hypothetical protein [Hyphomicrobiales bacterium]